MNNTLKILPARELVASKIRNKIFLGELKPGESLKQEELAREFGVSRMPIREAIRLLVNEGVLEAVPNKSAVVSIASLNYIQDYFDVRILLECRAIEIAVKNSELLKQLLNINEKYQEAFKRNDLESIDEVNFQFHATIWEFSNNFKLKSMLLNLWNGLPKSKIISDLYCTIDEHTSIIDAIREKDSEQAKRFMKEHLLKSMERYLELKKNR